jgi:putative FmdB family regulatory protein
MAAAARTRAARAAPDARRPPVGPRRSRAEREQRRAVLEAVGDGVFFVDDDGASASGTAPPSSSPGSTRRRARPAAPRGLRELGRRSSRDPDLEGAAAAPVTLPVELDGRELWLSFVAVRSPTGRLRLPRPDVERRLEEAKSDFIATVSHELRTPMTAVLGAAQTLSRDDIELSPERAPAARDDRRAGHALTQITEEVLLASRSTAATCRRPRAGRLVELVRQPSRRCASARPSRSRSDRGANGGCGRATATAIEQVLVNLIDNAVKYSPDGGSVSSRTPRRAAVRVEVATRDRDPASEQRLGLREVLPSRPNQRAGRAAPASALHLPRARSAAWAGRSAFRSSQAEARPSSSSFRPLGLARCNVRREVEHAYPLLGSADTVPIYEYVCMECESHFEELVRNGEEPDCPDCASANVRKQFSVFATHGTAEQPSFGGPSGGCCGGSCGCGH